MFYLRRLRFMTKRFISTVTTISESPTSALSPANILFIWLYNMELTFTSQIYLTS